MEITCPLCESHKSQRLALTYAKGASKSRSKSIFVLAGGGASPLLMGLGFILFPISAPLLALRFLFMGFGGMYTTTKTETLLAAESRPPKRLGRFFIFLMAFCFFMVTTVVIVDNAPRIIMPILPFFATLRHGHWHGPFRFTPLALEALVWVIVEYIGLRAGLKAARHYNDVVWAQKEAAWQRSFLCKRCGAHFLVPDYDPIGVNRVRSDKAGTGEYLPRAETPEQRAAVIAKAQTDHALLRKVRPKDPWLSR
ncbi:MAG: hypothetical protein ACYDEV_00170 [Acidiferrobacter sp.]